MRNPIRNIKQFIRNAKRIIKWIPRLWNSYDFDYHYALDVFRYKLEDICDFMESDNANTLNASHHASRMRLVLRLMKKVYNEDYRLEYFDEFDKLYGKSKIEFIPTDNPDYSEVMITREKVVTDNEKRLYDIHHKSEIRRCQKKQEKAHRLLWELMEHTIQYLWD